MARLDTLTQDLASLNEDFVRHGPKSNQESAEYLDECVSAIEDAHQHFEAALYDFVAALGDRKKNSGGHNVRELYESAIANINDAYGFLGSLSDLMEDEDNFEQAAKTVDANRMWETLKKTA